MYNLVEGEYIIYKIDQVSDEDFKKLIYRFENRSELLKSLDIVPSTHNYKLINKRVKLLNLDISHFKKNKSHLKKLKREIKICEICGQEFEIVVGSNKKQKVVCSKSCSNTMFRSGENHPNYKEPSQRARQDEVYRTLCFSNYESKCIICGFDCTVDVHHIDENHENNIKENLVPLCPNHHRMIHMDKYKEDIKNKLRMLLTNTW